MFLPKFQAKRDKKKFRYEYRFYRSMLQRSQKNSKKIQKIKNINLPIFQAEPGQDKKKTR